MNKDFKKLMLTAAVTGLIGGATARLQAAPVAAASDSSTTITANKTMATTASAGKLSVASVSFEDPAKHGCKGKNDCKGQGGCKTGDNGCKGKNSCKGNGGCATDGSKSKI
jgi:hypothetical protein